jgi:hypothetical protein
MPLNMLDTNGEGCRRKQARPYLDDQRHKWKINPTLSNDLKKAGVLRNKHIPSQYFVSDVKQRVALLQGLMDTDGTISESGQCEFTQMSGQLASDVKRLLNSLGVHCKPVKSDARIDGVSVGEKQDCCSSHLLG